MTMTSTEQTARPALTVATAYVVWSRKRSAWWGPNANGYTEHLAHAGVYTEEAAREAERQSEYGPEHLRSQAHALAALPVHQLQIRPGTVMALLTQGES